MSAPIITSVPGVVPTERPAPAPVSSQAGLASIAAPRRYSTLGDIAAELEAMKADGMARDSVLYAVARVFWEA